MAQASDLLQAQMHVLPLTGECQVPSLCLLRVTPWRHAARTPRRLGSIALSREVMMMSRADLTLKSRVPVSFFFREQ
jgi:hypothetical protein